MASFSGRTVQSIVIYFWVVVVWLEGRTVQIVSWQFVVPQNGGQDTRFPFKLPWSLVHGLLYRFALRCLPNGAQ